MTTTVCSWHAAKSLTLIRAKCFSNYTVFVCVCTPEPNRSHAERNSQKVMSYEGCMFHNGLIDFPACLDDIFLFYIYTKQVTESLIPHLVEERERHQTKSSTCPRGIRKRERKIPWTIRIEVKKEKGKAANEDVKTGSGKHTQTRVKSLFVLMSAPLVTASVNSVFPDYVELCLISASMEKEGAQHRGFF